MIEQGAGSPRPASPLLRAAAFLIDWAITIILAEVMVGAIGSNVRARLALLLVLAAVYEIGFVAAISATPGKIALRMYVGDEDGRRLTPDKAILRFLVLLASWAAFGVGFVIDVVLLLVDSKRRTLHDRVAKTGVFSGRPPGI
jgi:uncharacterized RDD family membrane protein YckC